MSLSLLFSALFEGSLYRLYLTSGTVHCRQLGSGASSEPPKKKSKTEETTPAKKEAPVIMQLIAEAASVNVDQIRDFELSVCDTQPAAIGGAFNEFIFSPRLDNLMMSFCGLKVKERCRLVWFCFTILDTGAH
jgi:hypothetical protein